MTSVFKKAHDKVFTYRRVQIQFENKLMGGTPKDPNIIAGFIRTKGIHSNEEELKMQIFNTMRDVGYQGTPDMSLEELMVAQNERPNLSLEQLAMEEKIKENDERIVEISERVADLKNTVGFKFDENGLYIEGRAIKAAIKESANIMFGGERAGPTRKGFKNYVAERIVVVEDKVYLNRTEPDGVETFTGHVTGPQGPRSTLTRYEYVEKPILTFHLKELKLMQKSKHGTAALTEDQWEQLFVSMEVPGIGAIRSQQFGRFETVEFTKIDPKDLPEQGSLAESVEKSLLAESTT